MLSVPHGGQLVNTLRTAKVPKLNAEVISHSYPDVALSSNDADVFSLLINGALSPLTGYMDRDTFLSTLNRKQLLNGLSWPVPFALKVNKDIAKSAEKNGNIALRDKEGRLLGIVRVSDIYSIKSDLIKQKLFEKKMFKKTADSIYVGGNIEPVQDITIYTHKDKRILPKDFRNLVKGKKVIGYNTSGLIPQFHMRELMSRIGPNDHILFALNSNVVSGLPVSTALGCLSRSIPSNLSSTIRIFPKVAAASQKRINELTAIMLKNYGCKNIIFGDNSPNNGSYLTKKSNCSAINANEQYGVNADTLSSFDISVEDIIKMIQKEKYPSGFAKGIVEMLKEKNPPPSKRGLCLFFTGLSGSGKSTIGNAVKRILEENDPRPIVMLDGDVVRHNLSKGLGFSKADRNTNILRIGYVASLVAKCGGIAICAPIAPYAAIRNQVRDYVTNANGTFIEIHVGTSLAECERRDTKGLYAKARKGLVKNMTGIDDPYEAPEHPELRLETEGRAVSASAKQVLDYLRQHMLVGF